jgi:ribosomal protein L14E/L6E/L27E
MEIENSEKDEFFPRASDGNLSGERVEICVPEVFEIKKGTVVRSAAGRDKGDFQVVVDFDGVYVTVCDGKHRPFDRPKRKKLKHVKPTKFCLREEDFQSDKSVKKALRPFIEAVADMGKRKKAGHLDT